MYKGADFYIALVNKEDALALHKLMISNEDRFKTYFPQTLAANTSLEKSEVFIANISEDIKNKVQFLYTLKVDNMLAGLIYLKELDWKNKEGEFAYCIDKNYSGQGLIAKAVAIISQYALEKLQLETLKIISHHSNKGSIRVAEKCGFKHFGTLPNEYTPPNGVPLDMQLFELRK